MSAEPSGRWVRGGLVDRDAPGLQFKRSRTPASRLKQMKPDSPSGDTI